MAAFATSAFAAAFSSSDNLAFLSIEAILASDAVWIASRAFSLPTGVTASTKACFAASNAAFFSLTLFKASFTWATVASVLSITVWAAWIASWAAVFASLYVFALSAVFPVVGSASVAKVFNASFAFFKTVLSTFNASCFDKIASNASLYSTVFLTSALVTSVLIFSNSAKYAAFVSFVFPSVSADSVAFNLS